MPIDTGKCIEPAIDFDVAKLVNATRQRMIDLYDAMMATSSGRPVEAQE